MSPPPMLTYSCHAVQRRRACNSCEPLPGCVQMGSHLNAAVQQSMTLSSLALFAFTMMYSEKANALNEPTVFSESPAMHGWYVLVSLADCGVCPRRYFVLICLRHFAGRNAHCDRIWTHHDDVDPA